MSEVSKFSIGDKVRTHDGEVGVIDHAWTGEGEYAWWVVIPIKDSAHKQTIPYRESELTLVTSDEEQAVSAP